MLRLWWFLLLSIVDTYYLLYNGYKTIFDKANWYEIVFFIVFLIVTPYAYTEVIKSIKKLKD
jgi:cbb3-type cytochrome oxidase subunit 3